MRRHTLVHLGSLTLTTGALAIFAGCSNVSTGASGAGVPSPTPSQSAQPTPSASQSATPQPTATPPETATGVCSFIWETDYSDVDGTIDFYEVDIATNAFNNNTNKFDGTNAVGYFVSGYDPNSGDILYGAGMSTAGSISLSIAGTTMGDETDFHDTASHTFFDATDLFLGNSNALGSEIATGGTGDFVGQLSNPDPNTAATPGQGSIDATDNGGNTETFGDPTLTSLAFSACSP